MSAAIRELRCIKPSKEENARPSRKLVQGRQVRRSVSRSALLSGGTFGNAIRRPCPAKIEEREISRTVRGDVSMVRLHRSSLNGIAHLARKGHILVLKVTWTTHECREVCFGRNSSLVKVPYESWQSKGCMSRNVARRHADQAAGSSAGAADGFHARGRRGDGNILINSSIAYKAIWLSSRCPIARRSASRFRTRQAPAHCLQAALANRHKDRGHLSATCGVIGESEKSRTRFLAAPRWPCAPRWRSESGRSSREPAE
jgi:hypothetical protein